MTDVTTRTDTEAPAARDDAPPLEDQAVSPRCRPPAMIARFPMGPVYVNQTTPTRQVSLGVHVSES